MASVRCARALRRHGFTGSILIVGEESTAPYNRPPLSKELLRDDLPADLVLAEPASWYDRRRIELRTGVAVAELDPDAGSATLDDGTVVTFERCLLATGATPRHPPIPGGDAALVLRTLGDARRLRQTAVVANGGRATVIGGGLIGVEVASGLATLGVRPSVVELADRLWGGAFGERLDLWARERLADAGVEVRLGATVDRLGSGAAWVGGERLDHDFALAGVGVEPRTDLAAGAGLAVDRGIVTDDDQRSTHPRVWAAGDVARVAGRRVEHWHAAREQGERAALSMLGLPVPPARASWTFTEVAGVSVDVIGDAAGWDEERWLGRESVLAYLRGARAEGLAVIASALDPSVARELVERRAPVADVEAAIG